MKLDKNMPIIYKSYFNIAKKRCKNEMEYHKYKFIIIIIASLLISLIYTFQSISGLRLKGIDVKKVDVTNFESGLLKDTPATVTIFIQTNSNINGLSVTLIATGANNNIYKSSQLIDATANPIIFDNKVCFKMPNKIHIVKKIKVVISYNNQRKEIIPSF